MLSNTELSCEQLQQLTLVDIIEYGQQVLIEVSDSAKLDVELLLAFVLKKDRSYLFTWPEKQLNRVQSEHFLSLLQRRCQSEPIAYLLGVKEFWSLSLKVSQATLIPRPDTEVLVEQILQQHTEQLLHCLDLGTGTGAIALALASERPCWHIDAIDVNQQAVMLAKENAQSLALSRVNFFQSHWFEQVEKHKKYHIIVSNPPYIDPDDDHIKQGDVKFEPLSALVAKEKGLADIKMIATQAKTFLHHGGWLYLEHGFDQKTAVQSILTALFYKNIVTVQDYNGHDRMTKACLYL